MSFKTYKNWHDIIIGNGYYKKGETILKKLAILDFKMAAFNFINGDCLTLNNHTNFIQKAEYMFASGEN